MTSTSVFNDRARWIWLAGSEHAVNQYVCFRRDVVLEDAPAATLYLAIDTDYQLVVNGQEVYGRQFPCYPHDRVYNRHDLSGLLNPGRNVLAILGWYCGRDSSTYRQGQPGLLVQLEAGGETMVSDRQWRCRLSPSYTSGEVPLVTGQLGFTVAFDSRQEDDWMAVDFDDSGWDEATEWAGPTTGYWRSLSPRPLPMLEHLPYRAGTPVDGNPLLVDVGCEEVGLLQLEVEAAAGTEVAICHGEHLDDGCVRAEIGGRTFIDRLICRDGVTSWTLPLRRLGCRFLELRSAGDVQVNRLGLEPIRYPVAHRGSFHCSDQQLNDLYDVAVRTLELCMHEHYEDCPWREQALYAFDSRNQALYGYYAFGEVDFPAVSFGLLAEGVREDGLMELCAPARVPITIPIFSLVWIVSVRDHWLFSGSDTLYRRYAPVARGVLEAFLSRRDAETGLCQLFHGDAYWCFYEWADGLSSIEGRRHATGDSVRLDAPHNLFLADAMEAYADLLSFDQAEGVEAWRQRAADLRRAVHDVFWDEDKQLYASFADGDGIWHYCELTQSLAGLASELPRKDLVPMTLSPLLYMAERPDFVELCKQTYGSMLEAGATSLWEMPEGADAFEKAGSLCHAWSSVPVWLGQGYLLGVQPTAPGFRTFTVAPRTAGLDWAAGTIPTPHGPIHVQWEREEAQCTVTIHHPAACRCAFVSAHDPDTRFTVRTMTS